jgi:hypothetical protein
MKADAGAAKQKLPAAAAIRVNEYRIVLYQLVFVFILTFLGVMFRRTALEGSAQRRRAGLSCDFRLKVSVAGGV